LRILHVWDQAATASVIAKWQKKIGHTTTVIKNAKHDKAGMTKYYGGILVKNKYHFILKATLMARNYDVIHLHDAWFMVVPLKLFYRNKKIVLHYHGSLIRNKTIDNYRAKLESLVDLILVSTPDLLEYDYQKQPYYLPNPIDTDLFKQRKPQTNNRCFTSLKAETKSKEIDKYLTKDFDYEFQENVKGYATAIPYEKFHEKLEQYEYYADIPFIKGKLIPAHSVCGLQALNMGLGVLRWDGVLEYGLPSFHKPESVVKELDKFYQSVFQKQ
jgi:hypothetical protein